MRNSNKEIDMGFFTRKQKTEKELQAELVGLCRKMELQSIVYSKEANRYEKIIAEMYLRDIIPTMTLKKTPHPND